MSSTHNTAQTNPTTTTPTNNDDWGSHISTIKDTAHTRIAFQNIHGIPHRRPEAKGHQVGAYMTTHNIDIFGISETNLDWTYLPATAKFLSALRTHTTHTLFQHAQSMVHFDTPFQPGGTAIVVQSHWVGHACQTNSDCMGRWTITTLQGRNRTKISIISAYIPPQESINACGPRTAYSQQWTMLRDNQTNPEPRRQAFDDLTDMVLQSPPSYHSYDGR